MESHSSSHHETLVAIITFTLISTSNCYLRKCYLNWNYCLLTYVDSFNSFEEAQRFCLRVHPKGSLLETYNQRALNLSLDFIASFPIRTNETVVLNALQFPGGQFYWNKMSQIIDTNEIKGCNDKVSHLTIFNNQLRCVQKPENFIVVCMIECPSLWTKRKNNIKSRFKKDKIDLRSCKKLCLHTKNCKGIVYKKFTCRVILSKSIKVRQPLGRNYKTYMYGKNKLRNCLGSIPNSAKAIKIFELKSSHFGMLMILTPLVFICMCVITARILCKNVANWNKPIETGKQRKTLVTSKNIAMMELRVKKLKEIENIRNVARLSITIDRNRRDTTFLGEVRNFQNKSFVEKDLSIENKPKAKARDKSKFNKKQARRRTLQNIETKMRKETLSKLRKNYILQNSKNQNINNVKDEENMVMTNVYNVEDINFIKAKQEIFQLKELQEMSKSELKFKENIDEKPPSDKLEDEDVERKSSQTDLSIL